MPQPQDELHAWLALVGSSAASRRRARLLLGRFGGPLGVFQAGAEALEVLLGRSGVAALVAELAGSEPDWQRTRAWLQSDLRHHVLTLADAQYPAALLASPDPPLLLHAAGDLQGLQQPGVAIVGSRRATPLGRQTAHRLAVEFTDWGIPVVSGLASGIDAAAHEGALSGAGAFTTVAVVGNGLDNIYPRQHEALAQRIMERGLILSEHPLGTSALPAFFPQRNRIIAGLAMAVAVIEAAPRSGSLITARLAAEAGRDVFAVPGPITSLQSQGCNGLIKAGAGLLEGASDVIASQPSAFGPGVEARYAAWLKACTAQRSLTSGTRRETPSTRSSPAAEPTAAVTGTGAGSVSAPGGLSPHAWQRLSTQLRTAPCSVDDLATAVGAPVTEISQCLLLAEIEGLVGRMPGGLYQWTAYRL